MTEFLLYWGGYGVFVVAPAVVCTAVTIHRFVAQSPPQSGEESHAAKLLVRILIGFWLWIVILPFLPYLWVECQTLAARRWCQPLVQQAVQATEGKPMPIQRFKVLWLSPRKLRVYVVLPCSSSTSTAGLGKRTGIVYEFKRVGARWILTGWEGVWSECGSAKGNAFPPYADQL